MNFVDGECTELCSMKTPSVLRKSDSTSLIALENSAIVAELKERTPVTYRLLNTIIQSKEKDKDKTEPVIVSAAGVLMKGRNVHMSAWGYRNELGLKKSGVSKQVGLCENYYFINDHTFDQCGKIILQSS